MTFGVQHNDGIILDPIHQQTIALPGLLGLFFCLPQA